MAARALPAREFHELIDLLSAHRIEIGELHADPGRAALARGLLGRQHVHDVSAQRDLVPFGQPDLDADLAQDRRRLIGRDEHAALTDIGRVQLRELGPALALDEERVIRWMALALTPVLRHRN